MRAAHPFTAGDRHLFDQHDDAEQICRCVGKAWQLAAIVLMFAIVATAIVVVSLVLSE